MTASLLTVTCPGCGTAVAWLPENRDRPFCSPRCRLIDLGAWAAADYTISAETRLPATDNTDAD